MGFQSEFRSLTDESHLSGLLCLVHFGSTTLSPSPTRQSRSCSRCPLLWLPYTASA